MKQIQSMINSEVRRFNFDEKTGAMEIELKDEKGAIDFLKMKLAALYMDSCRIDYDFDNVDFEIKEFDYLYQVFDFLNYERLAKVRLMTEDEIKNPDQNWLDYTTCFYSSQESFKQRLVFAFDLPILELKDNQICYVSITMDIIESNYAFYV